MWYCGEAPVVATVTLPVTVVTVWMPRLLTAVFVLATSDRLFAASRSPVPAPESPVGPRMSVALASTAV